MADSAPTSQSFGSALKVILDEKSLSQRQFAKQARLTTDYVSKLVNGEIKKPRNSTVEKIAAGLNLSVDDFWQAIGAKKGGGSAEAETVSQETSNQDQPGASEKNAVAETKPASKIFVGAEQIREIPVWVGREKLLEKLTRELLIIKRKVIVLQGQGGIGKTSLAVKLLEQARIDSAEGILLADCPFEQVIYLRVGKGTGFDAVVQQVALGIELKLSEEAQPEQKINTVLRALKQQHYLLVLDNFEDALEERRCRSAELGQLLWAMVDRPHLSQVILTSREMVQDLVDPRAPGSEPNPMQVRVERLPGIGHEASVALLKQYGLEDTEEDLRWVAWRVGGHVLLLTLLAKLAVGRKGYLRKHPNLVSREAGPMLEEQLARQSGAAVELLKRMCVPRGAIGAEGLTFLRLYEEGQEPRIDSAEVEQTELLLKQLRDASLVQRRYDEERCEDLYDLHQVIVDFLQAKYTAELPELMQRVYGFYRAGSYVVDPKSVADLEPVLEAHHFALQLRNYGEAWRLLSWNAMTYLKRWGHWSQLKDLLLNVVEYLEGSSKASCLAQLGMLNRDLGNWTKAEKYISQSLKLREALGDRSGMASSWGILGDIEKKRGNWNEAERLFRQSLKLREKLGDRPGIASIYGQWGDVHRNRGNWDEAERLFRQCLEIEEELGDRSGMATSWGVLGDIERMRGNYTTAEQLKRQSFELRRELGDRAGMCASLRTQAEIAAEQEKWDKSQNLIDEAIEIATALNAADELAWMPCMQGRIQQGRGNFDLAESLLKEALSQMEQLGMPEGIAKNHSHLAKLYRAKNNPDLAQTHYQTAHQLFTQLGAAKDLERIEKEWADGTP